jgi:hypothetical protein
MMAALVQQERKPGPDRDGAVPARDRPATAAQSPPHPRIAELQRAIGNRAVGRLLQRKLIVNAPGDAYEQEADRVAEAVMQDGSPPGLRPAREAPPAPPRLQRACSCGGTCADCRAEKAALLRKEAGGAAIAGTHADAPPIVHEVLSSPGQPLDQTTRAFFEPRFGRGFEDVRIHADARADESARSIAARAYTSGPHVVFASGQYAPQSRYGMSLIAHELAHVVQQSPAATAAAAPAVPNVMRDSWTSSIGEKYEQLKEAAYSKLIDGMRKSRIDTVKILRARVPSLPAGMQSAANSIVDVVDFVLDLFIGLDLALVGLVVGFAEGIVGLLVGISKLVYGVIKLLVDLVAGIFDNFDHFKEDIDAIATGIKRIPEGLKIIISSWWERYKSASPERQALMGGELVGQVEAFIATFAFAGAKAGQLPKLTLATQFEVRMVATTTGELAPTLVVTGTKTFGVAEPVAAAAITSPSLMSAAAAGGGGGGKETPKLTSTAARVRKIPYGEGPLSQLAQRLRLRFGLRRGGNVAVFEFESIPEGFEGLLKREAGGVRSGEPLQTGNHLLDENRLAIENVEGSQHSERFIDTLIKRARGNGMDLVVRRIYSEYSPCAGSGGCFRLVTERYPSAAIEYSFEYDFPARETAARDAAINELFSGRSSGGGGAP